MNETDYEELELLRKLYKLLAPYQLAIIAYRWKDLFVQFDEVKTWYFRQRINPFAERIKRPQEPELIPRRHPHDF